MEKSAEISLQAITELEKLNFRLYDDNDAGTPDDNRPGLSNPAQRRIRYSVIDFSNPSPKSFGLIPGKKDTMIFRIGLFLANILTLCMMVQAV